MAKIGLTSFRYGLLTESADGTPSYAGALIPGKAVSCSVSPTNNSAELYANDGLAESDYSWSKASVTMGIDKSDITTMGKLLGHTVTEASGDTPATMLRNANDTAPYVGLGRIVTEMVEGVRQYTVEFLYKVKFSEPSQDNSTKGESVEFATTEIEGTASSLANGNWSITSTFATKESALTYLEGLLGTTPSV